MNEVLLQQIHRAIQGDRAALRGLVERYQGVSYALAYRHAQSFPRAQRVAASAWALVAARLPKLGEPERFPELIANAVERAFKELAPAEPAEEEGGAGHSVLRTEKVQARRALRQALAACPLQESTVFFLRYVQGATLDEIAALYGAEPPAVLASFKAVCVDLAYRAGFVPGTQEPPAAEGLSPERREARGYSVALAEGSLPSEAHERLARIVQTDPECRREDEGVRTVLALATGTFAPHHLAGDFTRNVMLGVPYADVPREIAAPSEARAVPAAPSVLRAEVPQGPLIVLALVGLLGGLVAVLWLVDCVEHTRLGRGLAGAVENMGGRALGTSMFLTGLIFLGLWLARPPLRKRRFPIPPSYYLFYGVTLGGLAAFWHALAGTGSYSNATLAFILEFLVPIWALTVVVLVCVRARLALRELERRTEIRLRRLEEALPGWAAPPPPASAPVEPAATPPPAAGAPSAAGTPAHLPSAETPSTPQPR